MRCGSKGAAVLRSIYFGTSLIAACTRDIDKPPAPDMANLIDAYANPTAELTADDIPDVYQALTNTFDWFGAICGWDAETVTMACGENQDCRVCHGLDPMSSTFRAVSNKSDSDARELSRKISGIDGFMTIERVCPGFGEQASLDPENGYLRMQVGFTSRGIDPVFGGTFDACQVGINDVPTTLDGDIAFAFDHSFFLDELPHLEPIVRFRGTVRSGDNSVDLVANFRVSALGGGDFAISFDIPNEGTMVFFNGRSGQGLSAANGRFSCTFDHPSETPMACVNVDTGEEIP